MNNTKRVVLFEPYIDPILAKSKRHPLDGDGHQAYFNQFTDSDDGDDEEYSTQDEEKSLGNKIIMTELGPLGVNKRSLMIGKVSMWLCNTNFTISDNHINVINEVSGVEILKPLSRYRFLVGFSSLFDCEVAKKKIVEKLNKTKAPYAKLEKFAKTKFKHYAIISDDEEEYELISGETIDDVNSKISDLSGRWTVCKKY